MNFITKPLSNTNVYSDKLQIIKSKKNLKDRFFCNCKEWPYSTGIRKILEVPPRGYIFNDKFKVYYLDI